MPPHSENPRENEKISIDSLLRGLQWTAAVLILIGMYNVYSSTNYVNLIDGFSPYRDIVKHSLVLIFSVGMGILIKHCPFLWRLKIVRGSIYFFVVGLLVIVFWAGDPINGAQRWIYISGFSIQPSEFAKVAAILFTAKGLEELQRKKVRITLFIGLLCRFFHLPFEGTHQRWMEVLRVYFPLLLPVFFFLLVLKQPDMGTAVLILLFPLLLYVLCGIPAKEILLLFLMSLLAGLFLVQIAPYRMERLTVLFNPYAYADNIGYQVVQSLIAVGSGGFWGQGLGLGLSKFSFLPERSTDFAFAVLSQEGGFVLSVLVVFLFGTILLLGFLIAGRIQDTFGALMVYGLSLMISVQGLLNMAMVVGWFPVTGVPLPFISFGGSALLTNCCAVGLIGSAVTQEKRRWKKRKTEDSPMPSPSPVSLERISGAVFNPPPDDRFRKY